MSENSQRSRSNSEKFGSTMRSVLFEHPAWLYIYNWAFKSTEAQCICKLLTIGLYQDPYNISKRSLTGHFVNSATWILRRSDSWKITSTNVLVLERERFVRMLSVVNGSVYYQLVFDNRASKSTICTIEHDIHHLNFLKTKFHTFPMLFPCASSRHKKWMAVNEYSSKSGDMIFVFKI